MTIMLLESLDSIVWIKELLQEQQRKTCSSNALFEKPKSGNIATPVLPLKIEDTVWNFGLAVHSFSGFIRMRLPEKPYIIVVRLRQLGVFRAGHFDPSNFLADSHSTLALFATVTNAFNSNARLKSVQIVSTDFGWMSHQHHQPCKRTWTEPLVPWQQRRTF